MTKANKLQVWNETLDQWKESGMSIVGFCRKMNLSVATFHYWKKKLLQSPEPSLAFREISVIGDSSISQESGVWFDFGNGARLVLGCGFDADTLARTLRTVGQC